MPDDLLRGLRWRSIGPYRGAAASVAVTGLRDQPYVYYFGGTGGGIWKTSDGGIRWSNVSDGQLGTGSVGAVAVAASDANVVYAGMGEGCIRGNVSHGDGVYRSTDAGRTWTHVGPARHASRSAASASTRRDPDLVYVAALGHAFGPNTERGVFRSKDGGQHLAQGPVRRRQRRAPSTSTMDPDEPARPLRRLLAGACARPGASRAAGPGSGALQDDGRRRHLEEDRRARACPKGPWGRVGVDRLARAARAACGRVIEAEDGGVFRSRRRGRDLEAHERRAARCASAPGTTRTSSRTRRTRTRCTS